jgi:hypothetical protein
MKKTIMFIVFLLVTTSSVHSQSSLKLSDTIKSDLFKTKYFVGAGISTYNIPEIIMLSAGISFEMSQNIFLSPQFDYYLINKNSSSLAITPISVSIFMNYGFEIKKNDLFNYIGLEGGYNLGYFTLYLSDKIEQKISTNTYIGAKIRIPVMHKIFSINFYPEFNLFFTQNY